MFIGHYSVSFVAKAADTRIPLWVLFLATQLVDIFWAVFILLGIEKLGSAPDITANPSLDLSYMPYTHSLLASVLWSGAAVVVYKLLRSTDGSWRMGVIVGLSVFSHWVLDLLVHRPDLPLYDNTLKVGLGLWNYPIIAFLLEAGLLAGGLVLYLRATAPGTQAGRYGMLVFGAVLILFQASIFFGTVLSSPVAVAITGLASYFAFAGAAYWLEKQWQLPGTTSP